jgi:iron(III) transport system substrate-binding protein
MNLSLAALMRTAVFAASMKLPTAKSVITAGLLILCGCQKSPDAANQVVVYTSVDDIFARPVAEQFQKQTGITVKLVPDTEETKSTGLLNRLIAEKGKPVADVFWSGDPMRTAVLKAKGISAAYKSPNLAGLPPEFSDPESHWSALSARARVFIYNKGLVTAGQEPRGLGDLVDPKWRGKACIANPLFGTTSMHAAAIFETMGEEKARAFFDGLKANDVKMLSSNGEVKRRVVSGEFAFGLTDTDDVNEAIKDGKPVSIIYPDAEGAGTLVMPNAVALIAGAPHGENGKKFIDYLLTADVERMLAASAAQMPLRLSVEVPSGVRRIAEIKAMPVDYGKLATRIDSLAGGFLRAWVASQ